MKLTLRKKVIIWLIGCLAISIIAFGELWPKLIEWLSPQGLQQHGVFHWGVFGLCLLWLWLKRRDILPAMKDAKPSPRYILVGLVVLALSLFLPRSDDFLIFLMLLGWLSIFTIIFKKAGMVPSILLAIYGFAVGFPIVMGTWVGNTSAILTTNVITTIFKAIGFSIMNDGTVLTFNSVNGDTISTVITDACSGYYTIGVFIALFSLMMIDIRLPLRKAWYVFLFGLIGTWLQNIIRIVITVVAGYYWGSEALESTHYNISYIIFPLWFALFAFIYLKQAGWRSKNRTA